MKEKEEIFKFLKKEFPSIKRDIPLKKYTTFKIGGPAEYFLIANYKKDLLRAVTTTQKLKIPIFIMGGGSNLLVSDKGLKGIVVRVNSKDSVILKSGNIVEAPTGANLGKVVDFSIKKYLKGLEWAGGLPGTFGGAIRGNAGAFGGEIKDSIFQVEALDNNFKLRKLSNKQCKFSYRNSIFKQKNWIVLSASLKLKKGNREELRKIADSHIEYRKDKHPLEYPNAGSIFKNVDFKKISQETQKIFLDKVKKDPFEIVPSAWFIIGAGLTGKKVGQAQVSEKHSNYIVNRGNAKALDVLRLIDLITKKVKDKYNINLEVEIQLVGF